MCSVQQERAHLCPIEDGVALGADVEVRLVHLQHAKAGHHGRQDQQLQEGCCWRGALPAPAAAAAGGLCLVGRSLRLLLVWAAILELVQQQRHLLFSRLGRLLRSLPQWAWLRTRRPVQPCRTALSF